MAITDPRVISDTLVALDWQSAEDAAIPSPPYSPRQFIVCKDLSRDAQAVMMEPEGTHGSFEKRFDGVRDIVQRFKKELTIWGGSYQLIPFLESVRGGQPTVANADLTETGDTSAQLSAYSLTGVRPYHNTSKYSTTAQNARLFWKITAAAFPTDVEVYRDSGMAAGDLVAKGTAAAAGAVTLAAQNNSGLSGSVTIAAAGITTSIVTQINKITYPSSNQYVRFFRLYYFDSDELVILSDCAVSQIEFSSSEDGELEASVTVLAKRRTFDTANGITVPEDNLYLTSYSHHELMVTKDVDGTPVTPSVEDFGCSIENNALHYAGNSATPQKIIKRGWTKYEFTMSGEPSDELMGLVTDSRNNTFHDYEFRYTLSSKTILFSCPKVRVHHTEEPGFSGEEMAKVDLTLEAYRQAAVEALTLTVEV